MKKKLIIQQMKPLSITLAIIIGILIVIIILYSMFNKTYNTDVIIGIIFMVVVYILCELGILLHYIFNCVFFINKQEKLLGINFESDMKNAMVIKGFLANILMSREWIVVNAVGYNRRYIEKVMPIKRVHRRNGMNYYSVKIYTIDGKKKNFDSMFEEVENLFYNWCLNYELALKLLK